MAATDTTRGPDRSLLREPQFLRYWTSEIIGELAAPITSLAIPIIAITLLGAGAAEMGALGALRTLPFLFFGLLAGVLVDRSRRMPILITCSLLSAVLLLLIPVAAITGALSMWVLYLEAFLNGAVGVVVAVAAQSVMPTLVGRRRLIEANRNVQMTTSGAEIVGPGIAGVLIQTVTAPIAILIDAVSYLVSAALLVGVHADEPAPPPARPRREIVSEIREGLGIVFGDRMLRSIMLCGTTHNIFSNGMLWSLYVLFATERLGLSPVELGLIFAAGGPGSLLGGFLVSPLARLLGLGPTIGAMQVLTGIARSAMPLSLLVGTPFLALAAGEFLLGVARTVFNVNQLSLRQAITPDHQQGRMNASIRFVMWSAVPFGAVAGGWLGETIGLEPTVLIGAIGTTLASLWIFLGPTRRLRSTPAAG